MDLDFWIITSTIVFVLNKVEFVSVLYVIEYFGTYKNRQKFYPLRSKRTNATEHQVI